MYDWPEISEQTDQFWACISELLKKNHLQPSSTLNRTMDSPDLWRSGSCLFSQTCGWPLARQYSDALAIIAAPTYLAKGCKGYLNSSRIVCRKDDHREQLRDFKGSRVTINALDSQSGLQALKSTLTAQHLAPPFFASQTISGAHRTSLKLVSDNKADIASIDPVSWALANRYDAAVTRRLRVIAEGPYTPGLPFVCSHNLGESVVTKSFQKDLRELLESGLDPSVRDGLLLNGIFFPDLDAYGVLETLDSEATAAGHSCLSIE